MHKLIGIFLIIIPFPVLAEFSLIINGHASHLDRFYETHVEERHIETSTHLSHETVEVEKEVPLNEENYGLGIQVERSSYLDYTAGFYLDSFNKWQGYAGAYFHKNIFSSHKLKIAGGGVIGAITHSKFNNGNIPLPGALPAISIMYKWIGVQVSYVPAFPGNDVSLVWSQFVIKL